MLPSTESMMTTNKTHEIQREGKREREKLWEILSDVDSNIFSTVRANGDLCSKKCVKT